MTFEEWYKETRGIEFTEFMKDDAIYGREYDIWNVAEKHGREQERKKVLDEMLGYIESIVYDFQYHRIKDALEEKYGIQERKE